MDNETLYNLAIEAIDNLFSDKSVSLETALENMRTLREEIGIKIDCLENDLRAQVEGVMKKKITTVKGYKVFNPDFTCQGFQFAENKRFKYLGNIQMCSSGFHFCEKASDCFAYYSFNPKNIVCEVEANGTILSHDDDSKKCTDALYIGRRLTWEEVLKVANEGSNNTGYANTGDRNTGDRNTGDRNTGNWNTGDSNTGNWNTGYRNTGDRNTGDRNTGNWNTGDRNTGNWNTGNSNTGDSNTGYRNTGAFCIDENPIVWLFDKPTKIKVRDWEDSEAVKIMSRLLKITIFIESHIMSDEEKAKYPTHITIGGYLKSKTMHEAWADMWANLDDKSKRVFLKLPNFNAKKFEIITGIKVR